MVSLDHRDASKDEKLEIQKKRFSLIFLPTSSRRSSALRHSMDLTDGRMMDATVHVPWSGGEWITPNLADEESTSMGTNAA